MLHFFGAFVFSSYTVKLFRMKWFDGLVLLFKNPVGGGGGIKEVGLAMS